MGSKQNYDFSDSGSSAERVMNDSPKNKMANTKSTVGDYTVGDTNSVMSSTKNQEISLKMKQIDQILKERLSNNWVSVRKAFLDLDEDFDGYLTAENFAKLIGGSAGSSKFDFNLLKMLIKMKNAKLEA